MSTPQDNKPVCLIASCDKPQHGRGFCQKHLYHYKRNQPLLDYSKTEAAPESASDDHSGCWQTERFDDSTDFRRSNVFNTCLKIQGCDEDITEIVMLCGNDNCFNYAHVDFDKSAFKTNNSYQKD